MDSITYSTEKLVVVVIFFLRDSVSFYQPVFSAQQFFGTFFHSKVKKFRSIVAISER